MSCWQRLRQEKGDTLVEVSIALAILSLVLASSFATASAAFRLGQSARERTQAINYLQQQAEALHNYRDNTPWPTLVGLGPGKIPTSGNFYMEPIPAGAGWQVKVLASGADYNPLNDDGITSSIFHITISASNAPPPDSGKKLLFTLRASWSSNGSGPNNTTQIDMRLVDTSGIKPLNCSVGGGPGGTPGC